MFRKALIAGVGTLVLGFFVFGRDLASYVHTSCSSVKQSVRDAVPVQFEIERARKMVHDLVPDIRKNMTLVAREELEVERLSKQIVHAEQRLSKEQADIMRLKTDLTSGQTVLTYAGRTYSSGQVKVDLANRFERFKTQDATLSSLREMHQVRQRSLDAARQKLEAMHVAKRQLAVEVENLEARLKMVEAREASSDYAFDDSQLSRAKELIGDLKTRLEVTEKLIDAEGEFADQIPLEEAAPENIVDQVTEYFEQHTAQPVLAAEQPINLDETL